MTKGIKVNYVLQFSNRAYFFKTNKWHFGIAKTTSDNLPIDIEATSCSKPALFHYVFRPAKNIQEPLKGIYLQFSFLYFDLVALDIFQNFISTS